MERERYMLHKSTDKITFFSQREIDTILAAIEEVYDTRIKHYDNSQLDLTYGTIAARLLDVGAKRSEDE